MWQMLLRLMYWEADPLCLWTGTMLRSACSTELLMQFQPIWPHGSPSCLRSQRCGTFHRQFGLFNMHMHFLVYMVISAVYVL